MQSSNLTNNVMNTDIIRFTQVIVLDHDPDLATHFYFVLSPVFYTDFPVCAVEWNLICLCEPV
jgi:hypothetical protein